MSIRVFMHAYVRVRSRFRSSTIVPGSNEILREPGKQIAASNEDYISSDLIKVTELTGTSKAEINYMSSTSMFSFFHVFIIWFAETTKVYMCISTLISANIDKLNRDKPSDLFH